MSGQQPPYGYPPPHPPGPPPGPPPGQPFGPPPGPPPGPSNTVLALAIAAAMLVLGGIGLTALLLLGGDGGDDPAPVAATRTTEAGTTDPTEPTESTDPTEPTEPTDSTEPPETSETTQTPEVTQPAGPPFELDPGDAYATPRNVVAAYVSALFEGDCGNVHAYATASNKYLARQCDKDPTIYLGSRIDGIGEPIGTLDATVSQVEVEATLGDSQQPLVLLFETTDHDGNWLVSDLVSLE